MNLETQGWGLVEKRAQRVIGPKCACSPVSYRQRLHQVELPYKAIFICMNKEMTGSNFQRCVSAKEETLDLLGCRMNIQKGILTI